MVKKSARRTRRTHSPAFKARVALAALPEDKTMAEWCQDFELHASQVIDWQRQLLAGAVDVFGGTAQALASVDLAPLHAWPRCMPRSASWPWSMIFWNLRSPRRDC